MRQLSDLIEKTLVTYVQALIAALLASGTFDITAWEAAVVAAIPAALTVVANGLPAVTVGLPFYVDVSLRTVRTFVASFLGYLIALPIFTLDVTVAKAAAVAAIPAALAVAKGALATRVGEPGTASLLPARTPATE